MNPTLIAVNPVRSVSGNVVSKLLSAYKLSSLGIPVSVSEEILLLAMPRYLSSGNVARVSDESKLSSADSVSTLGKPDSVRLVRRLEAIAKYSRSGRSFRLNVDSLFPDRLIVVNLVEPKVTDVRLLLVAVKYSRSGNVDKSNVLNWLALIIKVLKPVLVAVLRAVNLFPSSCRVFSDVRAETSIALNDAFVIERKVRAVFPVNVTPVNPSRVS